MSASAERPLNEISKIAHHEEDVMGTIVTIDLFGDPAVDIDEITSHLGFAISSLHEADDVFSMWKPSSPMSRVSRGELDVADAPRSIAEVLEGCRAARDLSLGWFDPWTLPGGVDPTGYVKGWAAQRALNHLLAAPVLGAIVNAAGDIAAFGVPLPNRPFQVGIVNPASTSELAAIVRLTSCIATSGSYERGPHLLEPRSGQFVTRAASASVTGPELGLADALATALAVAGEELLAVIEDLNEYEAFTISAEGDRRWTKDFPFTGLATQ